MIKVKEIKKPDWKASPWLTSTAVVALVITIGLAVATNAKRLEVEQAHKAELIEASLKQDEAAEHAYNVGKQEVAQYIIKTCATTGTVDLGVGYLVCKVFPKKEI